MVFSAFNNAETASFCGREPKPTKWDHTPHNGTNLRFRDWSQIDIYTVTCSYTYIICFILISFIGTFVLLFGVLEKLDYYILYFVILLCIEFFGLISMQWICFGCKGGEIVRLIMSVYLISDILVFIYFSTYVIL